MGLDVPKLQKQGRQQEKHKPLLDEKAIETINNLLGAGNDVHISVTSNKIMVFKEIKTKQYAQPKMVGSKN